jgi:hypothetical protein
VVPYRKKVAFHVPAYGLAGAYFDGDGVKRSTKTAL